MDLNDVLAEQKEEPKTETPEEKEQPQEEKVTSRRKEWQENEQNARAEGEGKVRDPVTGQWVAKPKEEKKEEPEKEVKKEVKEPPKQDMTDKERAAFAAAADERRKRQQLEARLAELEKKKAETKDDGTPKTFWDDPEGALAKHRQEMQQTVVQTKLATSEAIARSKYSDFDEKIADFGEILQQTPGLHIQWLQSPDPAEFAYKLGKNHLELKDAGSIDALRQKIEKEVRLKLETEYKEKADKMVKERSAIPASLSDTSGKSGPRVEYTGPTPLKDILHG